MISTHILDLKTGTPAKGVGVTLEKKAETEWQLVVSAKTNEDGRIKYDLPKTEGIYRLTFEIEPYLKNSGETPFFIVAPVTFQITDTSRNYHVPLLLSPYGYSTYRGS